MTLSNALPTDIDPEILGLIEAMNRIPGIETGLSCCGHGEYPIRVWFVTDRLEDLLDHLEEINVMCGRGWNIIAEQTVTSGVLFRLEGPVGAYDQAKEVAALLNSAADEVLAAGPRFLGWPQELILRWRSLRHPLGPPADDTPF